MKPVARRQHRKVALVCGDVGAEPCLDVVRLPHPRGLDAPPVLFARVGRRLLELQRRATDFGAWFVDDAVASDGAVLLATPYDARLSVLSLLTARAETRGKFVPLEDVVATGAAAHGRGLLALLDLDLGDLGAFCETNEKPSVADLRLVRLDDAKCVAWLDAKVGRVAAVLEAQQRARAAAAAPAAGGGDGGFVAASTAGAAAAAGAAAPSGPSRKATLRAVQAVCDYVADEWAAAVCERRGFALADVFPGLAKRPPPTAAAGVWEHDKEQQRLHELQFGTASTRAKAADADKKAVVTTKQATMAKAAKGTKSITSFFGAPKAKKQKT